MLNKEKPTKIKVLKNPRIFGNLNSVQVFSGPRKFKEFSRGKGLFGLSKNSEDFCAASAA